MILQFNDGTTMNIETINASDGVMSIKALRTDSETLKEKYSDEFATKKMICEGIVYENYTILDHITEYTGAIWEVVMFQTGSGEDQNVKDAMVTLAKMQAKDLDDEDANEVKYLFDNWSGDSVAYAVGDRVLYADVLYKVIQAHTSQPDWSPDVAVSLFVRCDDPGEEWPEWVQPTGAHDAYEIGYKVSHNGKHWINTINANTYEPGVYGWDEVIGE